MPANVRGGDRIKAALTNMAQKLGRGMEVRAGFLADATYPDGQLIAKIAAVQEFGGVLDIPEHDIAIYRKVNAAGDAFLRDGRFVKKRISNFSTTHVVKAHKVTIPARPFMRMTISAEKKKWAENMVTALKLTNYDGKRALALVGEIMKKDIQRTIINFSDPPNAPSTIRKKKFDHPLIDTGVMVKSVDYEVKDGSDADD